MANKHSKDTQILRFSLGNLLAVVEQLPDPLFQARVVISEELEGREERFMNGNL